MRYLSKQLLSPACFSSSLAGGVRVGQMTQMVLHIIGSDIEEGGMLKQQQLQIITKDIEYVNYHI